MAKKKGRKKRIWCLNGSHAELARKHGCTKATVSNALNFKTSSLLTQAIIDDAIANYKGKLVYLD